MIRTKTAYWQLVLLLLALGEHGLRELEAHKVFAVTFEHLDVPGIE